MSVNSSRVSFPQKIIIEISMLLGFGAFTVSLWGYERLFKLLVAVGYGLIVALISYLLISRLIQLANRYVKTDIEGHSNTVERSSVLSMQNSSSMSFPSTSSNAPERVKIKLPDYHQWSLALVEHLEWKVLQDVFIATWYAKGYLIRPSVELKRGYFYLYSRRNTKRPLGLLMFSDSASKPVKVEELDELYLIQTHDNLPLIILVQSGHLSRIAQAYCNKRDIKLQNTADLYEDIKALPNQKQAAILERYIKPDFAIPTCSSCDIKLIKKQEKKSKKLFWGCVAYPQCKERVSID